MVGNRSTEVRKSTGGGVETPSRCYKQEGGKGGQGWRGAGRGSSENVGNVGGERYVSNKSATGVSSIFRSGQSDLD